MFFLLLTNFKILPLLVENFAALPSMKEFETLKYIVFFKFRYENTFACFETYFEMSLEISLYNIFKSHIIWNFIFQISISYFFFIYRPINIQNTGRIMHTNGKIYWIFDNVDVLFSTISNILIYKHNLLVHIGDHVLAHEKQRRTVVISEKINCVRQKPL